MKTRSRALGLAASFLLGTLVAGEAVAGWSAPERARLARSTRASSDVVAALDAADEVRVIVVLARPAARAQRERVRERAARADAVLARLVSSQFHLSRRYASVSALAGRITRAGLLRLLESEDVVAVGIDPPFTAQLDEAVPLVALDRLHVRGYTGTGQVVGVLDTGINGTHEDLVGEVVGEHCFCQGQDGPGGVGCCPNGLDEQDGPGAGVDDNGHGTSVASVVTSNGTSAPIGGAPDADLVSVKMLSSAGVGSASDALAGLDWILSSRPDVTVVNLSFGGGLFPGDCDDADAVNMVLSEAIGELRARGVLSFAGSGNDGSGGGMISPACIRDAVSVSAVWDEALGSQTRFGCTDPDTQPDLVTCFGNSGVRTDLMAPGALLTLSRRTGGFENRAGTSFATPIGAACAAVLQAAAPGATAGEIEAAMKKSPVRVTDPKNGRSFPRVDCEHALSVLAKGVPTLPWPGALGLGVALLAAAAAVQRRAASRHACASSRDRAR